MRSALTALCVLPVIAGYLLLLAGQPAPAQALFAVALLTVGLCFLLRWLAR